MALARSTARLAGRVSARPLSKLEPPIATLWISARQRQEGGRPINAANDLAGISARPSVVAPIIKDQAVPHVTESSAPLPPPKPKRSRLRKWVVYSARSVLVVVLGLGGLVVYESYTARHPPNQLEHDPTKKRLVVLGNGWAATSFLKNLDTSEYNVTVISPRNYFLFTPLLPSVTVGTIEARSVMEPTRFITRHKARRVEVYEGEVTAVDPVAKTVTVADISDIKGQVETTTIDYDSLVYAVGAENNTFGIKGVTEHACFLKEIWDAEAIRKKLMDCVESATFKNQTQDEIDRLCHMIVVGGGPTGVEYAAELHDFLVDDLQTWYPELANRIRITLIEALPSVLPMFSKQLIDYTNDSFKHDNIQVLTRTMVKEVGPKSVTALDADKKPMEIPYGLLVWATGNTARKVTKDLMNQLGPEQEKKRGLVVDEHLRVLGAEDIYALGDCTQTAYSPTAQVASQQGAYLARSFNQEAKKMCIEAAMASSSQDVDKADKLRSELARANKFLPFHYSHQGSLAYIGSDKAIADIPFFNGNFASGGLATMIFWRSAYISTLFSIRNRTLVLADWLKTKILGRDVSRV